VQDDNVVHSQNKNNNIDSRKLSKYTVDNNTLNSKRNLKRLRKNNSYDMDSSSKDASEERVLVQNKRRQSNTMPDVKV
jgi:hypothetical protein